MQGSKRQRKDQGCDSGAFMRIVLFSRSVLSDWDQGSAHFLRGVSVELIRRGHDVRIFEPSGPRALDQLMVDHGADPIRGLHSAYPKLRISRYDPNQFDLDHVLDAADLVLAHEANTHLLVRRLAEHRRRGGRYVLLYHDTGHSLITSETRARSLDLEHYDGVLASGESLREAYLQRKAVQRAWTWHEAADTRLFKPLPEIERSGDLVWIGNWADGERDEDLREFLFEPARALALVSTTHGVRYPQAALDEMDRSGMTYQGWLPNYRTPEVYARFRFTAHVPRRPYRAALPGIPSIRVFEALACGTPLICSPWEDSEGLFRPGEDYLIAGFGEEMQRGMRALLNDAQLRSELAASGRRTILERHTCSHRADELLEIHRRITLPRYETDTLRALAAASAGEYGQQPPAKQDAGSGFWNRCVA
ncbi:MAG TPA: glycosyltransferase [Bryobacteraceae bacterium]|nr:glycosyltransferase [Bryobacteraceae bacterium]